MASAKTSIGDALFTKTKQRVLSLLYGRPERSFYTNEIMRLADIGRGAVGRELEKLTRAGLIEVKRSGNQNHYRANRENPVYHELLGIVRKSFGVADVLRNALQPFDEQIRLAFVYGSVAKGSDTAGSDIDLLLVGNDLSYGDIMEQLLPAEEMLGRPVNPSLYSLDDFRRKRSAGSNFLAKVLEQPKFMIKGEIDDIGEPGKNTPA